jgi:hypothetical protein
MKKCFYPASCWNRISSSVFFACDSSFKIVCYQLRVFKEDFDQERRDRELTRTKMEMLQKKLKDKTELNNSIQLQVTIIVDFTSLTICTCCWAAHSILLKAYPDQRRVTSSFALQLSNAEQRSE